MSDINNNIYNNTFLITYIFETFVINGIFTKFVYNPINTDTLLMPDKNKNTKLWEQHIKDNFYKHDINNKYNEAYNFLNNKMYDQQKLIKNKKTGIDETSLETIKNSLWFTGFGADWICQIQQYHHFIHNRVILVTGATGAGKSTIYPIIMLYAYKIINYNNNSKVICTAPRFKPVRENSARCAGSLGVSIIENGINQIQYKSSKDKLTSDREYHPTLRFVTDGSYIDTLIKHYFLKDTDETINEIINNSNYIDMLLVDESHENNLYITLLLTLVKTAIYINNSVSLGIISATMEYDELIYRTYYKSIDDNYKYPLNIYNLKNKINRNLLDRRIHLSKPFSSTNFKIIEYPYIPNKTKIDILQSILSRTNDGDILIFESGSADIKKTVNEINNSSVYPNNIIAIPYYTDISTKLKDYLDHIAEPDVRKKYRFPKKYDIFNYGFGDNEIKESQMVPEGTYSRFIIVATNIVEASVTIDSLSYVIDTGKQKKNIYDIETHKSNLVESYIARSNRTQRKGRVGRKKVGYFYQTYDMENINERGGYLICTDNIINTIVNKITIKNNKIIDIKNDPYLITDIDMLLPFIKNQYIYNDYHGDINSYDVLFDYPKIITKNDIIYPYSDGKYDYDQLIDENGLFYIIHPNEELDFTRDEKTYKIIKKKKNYINKKKNIFEYLQSFGIFDKNNIITKNGINILKLLEIFITSDKDSAKGTIEINDLFYFLHCYSFKKINNKLFNYLVHNGIIKWIFSNNKNINIKLNSNINTQCDFIAKSKTIPSEYYEIIETSYKYLKNNEISKENNDNTRFDKKSNTDTKIESGEIDNTISQLIYQNLSKQKKITNELKGVYLPFLIQYNILRIKLEYIYENLSKYNLQSLVFDTSMSNLDKYAVFSYLVVQYYSENLLVKLKEIYLYQNYFNRDINNLYQLLTIKIFNKAIIMTRVSEEHRQLIFYINSDDKHSITEIMTIPYLILKYIKKPIIVNNKLLKETATNIKSIRPKFLIENINPEFENYIYDIIKNYG